MGFFAEVRYAVLGQADEVLEVVGPHSGSGVAGVDGHGDVVDEEEVVAQEDAVGEHVAVRGGGGLGGEGAVVVFDCFFEGGLVAVAEVEGA